MTRTVSRIKRAIIIGFVAALTLSGIFSQSRSENSTDSWFISGISFEQNNEDDISVISDRDGEVEFRSFVLDLFDSIFG